MQQAWRPVTRHSAYCLSSLPGCRAGLSLRKDTSAQPCCSAHSLRPARMPFAPLTHQLPGRKRRRLSHARCALQMSFSCLAGIQQRTAPGLLVLRCLAQGVHAVTHCQCACRCQASDGSSSRNSGKPLEASARRPYKRMQMRPETGSSAEEDKRSQQAASAPDSVPSVSDSASWEQWKEVGCRVAGSIVSGSCATGLMASWPACLSCRGLVRSLTCVTQVWEVAAGFPTQQWACLCAQHW